LQQKLADENVSIDIAKNVEAYIATLITLPAAPVLKEGVLRAYAKGFQGVFEVMTAISGLGLLSSLLIASRPMDEALDSEHVLDIGEKENGACLPAMAFRKSLPDCPQYIEAFGGTFGDSFIGILVFSDAGAVE
jgi:hypothetical protein